MIVVLFGCATMRCNISRLICGVRMINNMRKLNRAFLYFNLSEIPQNASIKKEWIIIMRKRNIGNLFKDGKMCIFQTNDSPCENISDSCHQHGGTYICDESRDIKVYKISLKNTVRYLLERGHTTLNLLFCLAYEDNTNLYGNENKYIEFKTGVLPYLKVTYEY